MAKPRIIKAGEPLVWDVPGRAYQVVVGGYLPIMLTPEQQKRLAELRAADPNKPRPRVRSGREKKEG